MNILLQILDDGRITDAHGKEVSFESTVIVMTTNAGSNESGTVAGFGESVKTNEHTRVMKALEGFLRPEFINRVDEIIVFNRLTKDNFRAICRIMLGDLAGVLAEKGIVLEYGEDTVGYIAEKGFSEKYGARNLRRLIQTELEDPIASKIIASYRNGVTKVRARVSDGKEVIETE